MGIEICLDKQQWDSRLLEQEQPEFLQSWKWGEFQQSVGREVLRLQCEGWQGQGVVHRLAPWMKYLYFPRVNGRVVISNWKLVISDELAVFLKKFGYIFARFELADNLPFTIYQLPITKANNRQPQTSLILDINRTEGELLAQMHPKTRYNINLAQKKGVVVKEGKDVDIFWKLNQETIKRVGFKSHDKDYYKKMLEMDICRQLIAYYNNKPIASNILIIFGNTCTYLHGASGLENKDLMAPYLLQWEGIKLAKKSGCKNYDFWGVAPPVSGGDQMCFHNLCWDKNHSWSGVTRFKAGFGGNIKIYPNAVDIMLKPWQYRMYKLLRKILIKY